MSRRTTAATEVTRKDFVVRVKRRPTDGSTPSQEFSVRVRPVDTLSQALENGQPVLGDTVLDVIGDLLARLAKEEGEADHEQGHLLERDSA